MERELKMDVVTPERTVVKDEAIRALVMPSVSGQLGVLPNHAPMVVALRPGVLRYRAGEETRRIAVSGGFAEVSDNRVVVLADAAERGGDIDVVRARQARDRALARLRSRQANVDRTRAEAALQRAIARIRAATGGRGDRS